MSDKKIPHSASDLEQSRWADMVRDPKAIKKVLKKSSDLLGRLGKEHPIAKRVQDSIDLMNNGWAGEMLSGRNLLILAAALAYFISPIDVIPDFIPVIGWLDDIGVIGMALSAILPGRRKDEEAVDVDVVTREAVDSIAAALPNNWVGSDVSRELEAMEKQVDELGDDTLRMRLEEARNIVADPLRRVVFAGGFSAGKSSLINRLLDVDLLPVSPIPCTRALTTITYGEAPQIIVELKKGGYRESTDLSLLKDDAVMEEAKEITVLLPNEMLKRGLTLVDTCGLEYSDFDERAFSELPRSSALVFVKSLNIGSLDEAEGKFCREASDKLSSDHIIIALNKSDIVEKDTIKEMESVVRKFFVDSGLIGVTVFSSCSLPEVNDSGVAALRSELMRRADSSMQKDQIKLVNKVMKDLKGQISAGEAARELKSHLDEKQAAELKAHLAARVEKRIAHLEELGLKAKDRFDAHLRIFINETLMPRMTTLVATLPLDEQFLPSVTNAVRDALASCVKNEVSGIAEYFETDWKSFSEKDIEMLTADLAPTMPIVDQEKYDKIGYYLLPATSAAAFIAMPLFGWLTSVALPLYVLNKMQLGEKMTDAFRRMGPEASARKEFLAALEAQLVDIRERIVRNIAVDVIDPIVSKQVAAMREQIA